MTPQRKFPMQPIGKTVQGYCIWCCKPILSSQFVTHNDNHRNYSVECNICLNRFKSGDLAAHQQIDYTGVGPNEILIDLVKNDIVFPPASMEGIKNMNDSNNKDGAGPSK